MMFTKTLIHRILKPLSHLSLTVVILSLSMILIFAGTLMLSKLGLYHVQKHYFETFLIWKQFGNVSVPVFPGGMLIGLLFGINLIANFIIKWRLYVRQPGLFVVHLGIMVLCVGVFLQVYLTRESQLVLKEGKATYYSEDNYKNELVLTMPLDQHRQKVMHIPHDAYRHTGQIFAIFDTPYTLKIKAFYPNSMLRYIPKDNSQSILPAASLGVGAHIYMIPAPVDPEKNKNQECLIVELFNGENFLGTYLLSNALVYLQKLEIQSHTLHMILRPKRYFEPSPFYLKEFVHEKYAGTEIPRHFSSHVMVTDPATGSRREVHISMNQPFRYYGATYYQASFGENDTVSILQVVRNKSAPIPYFSCALVTLGLIWHFCHMLARYLKRMRDKPISRS